MSTDGFIAVARGCRVLAKESFTGEDGRPVYLLTLQGWGFTRKFMSNDRTEFESWPVAGIEVDCQAELEQTKDNTFKLVKPKFVPVKAKAGAA